ncbi:MAG: LptF/LptG family permease [Plectolyngbya sp. WJT66-NPBG17]|jgi:lipopolysaccharide export system permease protein|nr:LptF/LptG family permease [Plectolyngbya sp. WJT66-NPBG17]MBW4525219.1 LptF/LptG family permease [Phormidium tanganyikae FI6-MK23]
MSLVSSPPRSPISVLDRYIARQLMSPFIFGVAAFSSILVSVGAVFDLIRRMTELGLPLSIAGRVLLLRMPEFIALSFPMATLLSALMVYSRLSTDSELIALRSAGISVYRLIAPAIVLSLLVSALTFGFNEAIVPAAKYQATMTLERALKQDKPKFDQKNIVFQQYRDVKQPDGSSQQTLDRIFYAQRFDGTQMKVLTVLDFSQAGLNQIITANSAQWNYDQQTWDFFDGTIYLVAPNGSYRNILKFERQQIQLPRTPLDLATNKTDSAEMNIGEVQQYLQLVKQSGNEKSANQLRMRIQQKIAFPFVCLVFGLAGATLGTRPRRGGKGASFAISILIIFTYYLLSFVCDAFGRLEIFTPILAAWLPTVVGLSAVSWLLVRAAR